MNNVFHTSFRIQTTLEYYYLYLVLVAKTLDLEYYYLYLLTYLFATTSYYFAFKNHKIYLAYYIDWSKNSTKTHQNRKFVFTGKLQ